MFFLHFWHFLPFLGKLWPPGFLESAGHQNFWLAKTSSPGRCVSTFFTLWRLMRCMSYTRRPCCDSMCGTRRSQTSPTDASCIWGCHQARRAWDSIVCSVCTVLFRRVLMSERRCLSAAREQSITRMRVGYCERPRAKQRRRFVRLCQTGQRGGYFVPTAGKAMAVLWRGVN